MLFENKIVKHALIVSGPSASGKSTLIEQILTGNTDEGIEKNLPSGIQNWTFIDGNDVLKRDLQLQDVLPTDQKIPGVILHYDFVHILRIGFAYDYNDDPVFKLFDLCEKISIVDIRPSHERLFAQFSKRQTEQRNSKSGFSLLWRLLVHHPLRRLKQFIKGERHLNKEKLYADVDWLNKCYARWDQFLAGLANIHHENFSLIRVVPVNQENEAKFFRIIISEF